MFSKESKPFKNIPHKTETVDGYIYVEPLFSSKIKFITVALVCISIIVGCFLFIRSYERVEGYENITLAAIFFLWFFTVFSGFFLVGLYKELIITPSLLEDYFYNVPTKYKEAILKYARDYLQRGIFFENWKGWSIIKLGAFNSLLSTRSMTTEDRKLLDVLLEYEIEYPGVLSFWDYQGDSTGAFTIDWATAMVISFKIPRNFRSKDNGRS